MSELTVFWLIASFLAFLSAMVVISRNPVTSAISLVCSLFLIAALYAMLGADFVAAIQIIVYAGAIMVLFLFVIMLLNLRPETLTRFNMPAMEWLILTLTVIGFSVVSLYMLQSGPFVDLQLVDPSGPEDLGNTYAVGIKLFTAYLWPFELASILILLAIVAAVVIAKRKPGAVDLDGGQSGTH